MPKKSTKPAANNLRAWRLKAGMTQEQLAEAVNTAGNVIGLLESGERKLSPEWLEKLAPVLGTTPGFLLDHDPNDIDAVFLNAAMRVPPERRDQALEILRTFERTGTEG